MIRTNMRLTSFIILILGMSPVISAQPVSTTVDGGYSGGKHLQCKAYLSGPNHITQGKTMLLFTMPGTGAYTTYFNHPETGNIYFLSIDKPGILPDLNHPGTPIVNRYQFDYYTMNTLVVCAQNALYWATDYLKPARPKIILHGHSEGTRVMTNVINNLHSQDNKVSFKNDIKALILSGVILQPMSEVIAFQFKGEELEKLMAAYQKHDSDYLYNNYKIGWYWLDDALHENQSRLVQLSDLAKTAQGRALPIEILHGLLDEAVSAKAVQEFDKKNHASPENKRLNLHARYYNAGHELNETAVFDMNILHGYYFNRID